MTSLYTCYSGAFVYKRTIMTTINNRIRRMYNMWYQPDVYMELEDWIYIAQLTVTCLVAFGFGLFVGFLL